MRKSHLLGAMCTFTIFFTTFSANAALVSRLGGQAVYDTELNITWLSDGNAAAGSAFDDGVLNDGLMTWDSANAWAASLSVGGGTWRLPSALNSDGSICAGGTYNCTDSEMGHLFYTELGGTPGLPIINSGDPDLALFTNITNFYWLDTELNSTLAYGFSFGPTNAGIHTFGGKGSNLSVLAVYDGDISAVPVPAAVWLFGSGLLSLVGMARRKKA